MNIAKTVSPSECGIESDDDAWNEPLYKCDKLVGFNVETWGVKIRPWMQAMHHYLTKKFDEQKEKIERLEHDRD